MPYIIEKKGDCYRVMNSDTGFIHAMCTTMNKAKAQVRLLTSLAKGIKLRGK